MAMAQLEKILADTNFRRFFFQWAPQIFIGGLGMFGAFGLAAIATLYFGMQDLSGSSAYFDREITTIKDQMQGINQDLSEQSRAVETLRLGQSSSDSRALNNSKSLEQILDRIDELMLLINTNQSESRREARITELELLIRLDALELRRTRLIRGEAPTNAEIEAEQLLRESINTRKRELEALRGF